ncbi:MAG: AAA family ATPase [Phycisphaerae bacterium]|nr:AAA family ATPase [Phycisphaerae bacterium]MBN8596881.1 AAA family ATPase [Planctomycetota bacterium]
MPSILILAGPNGAGKTTISREVLANTLGITEFVNADVIAAGLSGFDPERVAFAAGRIMLARLRELAESRSTFAFESTLASRTFAPWLSGLVSHGWSVYVLYTWLHSPELAVRRVKARFAKGGHYVPPDVVERRYFRSAANFWHLYRPIATRWVLRDNSTAVPIEIAIGQRLQTDRIQEPTIFRSFMECADAGPQANEVD